MPVYLGRAPTPELVVPQRSPLIQTILLGLGIAYLNLAVFMLVFSEPPQFKHFLWAAALGIGCGLLTCRRNPEPAQQRTPGPAQQHGNAPQS